MDDGVNQGAALIYITNYVGIYGVQLLEYLPNMFSLKKEVKKLRKALIWCISFYER
jgi:hypothetical protein